MLDGQCLEEDEECAAALSERTRGKSKAGPRLVAAQREEGKVIKSEGNSPDVRTERDASDKKSNTRVKKEKAVLKKSSGQSLLTLNKWILMCPAILFNHVLICCG